MVLVYVCCEKANVPHNTHMQNIMGGLGAAGTLQGHALHEHP